jgi:hypothetical protein
VQPGAARSDAPEQVGDGLSEHAGHALRGAQGVALRALC